MFICVKLARIFYDKGLGRALVHIMLVASYIECLEEPGPNLPRDMGLRCEHAMASALAALEEATGLQREEIGGDYYAFRELDCFAEDLSNVA